MPTTTTTTMSGTMVTTAPEPPVPVPTRPATDHVLRGYVVGITADRRWTEQAELLRRRGASVVHGPTIRTLPLGPEPDLRVATELLIADPPDFLLANTGIGIRSWLAAADAWGLGEQLLGALARARIFARGPKASAEVHRAGLDVEARAESERLDDTVRLLAAEPLAGRRVAFQRHGEICPDALAPLAAAGADIVEVPVYRWILPEDPRPAIRLAEAVIGGRVHAVTFTSAPAVRNLFAMLDEVDLGDALRRCFDAGVIAACVGPVCAAAAVAEGIADPLVPERARLGPLIRALGDALVRRDLCVTLHGAELVLRGNVAALGAEEVVLSEREAAVLRTLVERRGAVCSKEQLLEAVWGDASDDPHVVEVLVARLRRRLGAAGAGIQSVPRRGYKVA